MFIIKLILLVKLYAGYIVMEATRTRQSPFEVSMCDFQSPLSAGGAPGWIH